jgi:hypothetical protein
MLRQSAFGNYSLALQTLGLVALLVIIRAILWELGIEGIKPTALASSIVGGGVFVMGLVVAGTLSDYRDAERAPTELAAGLYAILREAESYFQTWGHPNLQQLRERLVAIVDALRRDIDAGNTRDCQAAIEDLSESFLEMEGTDVPANYIVRLRAEQAGLRKTLLRVYHIQREEFLPSAYVMICSFVIMIIVLLMFTRIEGQIESLVTLAFLSFFFVYLLRLLSVIDKPFKVGAERGNDDVSLFLLYEFVVHATMADQDLRSEDVVAIAEQVEQAEAATPASDNHGQAANADVSDLADIIEATSGDVAAKDPDPRQ